MTRQERILATLTEKFEPQKIEVVDFSHQHSAGADAQSHIEVYIIADAFNGLNLVKKHRLIYSVLQNEMQSGLHALKLQVFGTAEAAQVQTEPPRCKGGG